MRFQVPQFINIEDKIFGPLTLKQFIYLAGAGGLCFILIKFLPLLIGIVLSIPVVALGISLAFYQINNKPFIVAIENAFYYFIHSKLYLWRKTEREPVKGPRATDANEDLLYVPKLSDSKLKDLTWSLDAAAEGLNPVTHQDDSDNR